MFLFQMPEFPDDNLPSWVPVQQAINWLTFLGTLLAVGSALCLAMLGAAVLISPGGISLKSALIFIGAFVPVAAVAAYYHHQWKRRFQRASKRHANIFAEKIFGNKQEQ